MIKADKHFFYIVHHLKSVSIIWKNISCLYFFGPLISNKNVIFDMKVEIFDNIICYFISLKSRVICIKSKCPGFRTEMSFFFLNAFLTIIGSFPGVNSTKLFSSQNKDFFRFLLLSLAISKHRQYFLDRQTLQLNNKNLKNEEIKVW
jgi:hypothetical protein